MRNANPPPAPPAQISAYRIGLISLLAAAIGCAAGLIAFALYDLIGLFTNLAFYHQFSFHFRSPEQSRSRTLGHRHSDDRRPHRWLDGKIRFTQDQGPRHPGSHGSRAHPRSRIQPRVAILKPISAAIAIGTGGPFGAEGPIIQTGGAIGSLVGQFLHTTASERKVLLACGAAAGMSATFNTPIAGVILAIELLLFEFKSRSFIPLVIASTLATAVHMQLLGAGPMFSVTHMDFNVPRALPYYLLLGVLCGLAAVGFSKLLYWVEDQFEKLPVDELWWPAIGALGLGVIGYFVPRVLGVGYDTISDILNGQLALKLLVIVMLAKAVALVISLGSGTSGGLLAPMFMSSAAMGGSFALIADRIWPAAHLSPAAFALVAMGAVFGAASRATFSFIIFAFEITRDYNAVLPLMLVSVLADGVAIKYLPSSIMTEKLSRRGLDVHQEFEADLLKQARVRDIMRKDVATLLPEMTLRELGDSLAKGRAGMNLTRGSHREQHRRTPGPAHPKRSTPRPRRKSRWKHHRPRSRHKNPGSSLRRRARLRRPLPHDPKRRRPPSRSSPQKSQTNDRLPKSQQRTKRLDAPIPRRKHPRTRVANPLPANLTHSSA